MENMLLVEFGQKLGVQIYTITGGWELAWDPGHILDPLASGAFGTSGLCTCCNPSVLLPLQDSCSLIFIVFGGVLVTHVSLFLNKFTMFTH